MGKIITRRAVVEQKFLHGTAPSEQEFHQSVKAILKMAGEKDVKAYNWRRFMLKLGDSIEEVSDPRINELQDKLAKTFLTVEVQKQDIVQYHETIKTQHNKILELQEQLTAAKQKKGFLSNYFGR